MIHSMKAETWNSSQFCRLLRQVASDLEGSPAHDELLRVLHRSMTRYRVSKKQKYSKLDNEYCIVYNGVWR